MSKHREFTSVYDMENFGNVLGMILDPNGIESQERRGQAALVRGQHLPKELHGTTWEKLKEAWNVQVLGEVDDLFYEVVLPQGWKIERTDHNMWTKLVDDKGRERASIFYKAAFYDRSAHMGLTCRYGVHARYEDFGTKNEKCVIEARDGALVIKEFGVIPNSNRANREDFLKYTADKDQLQADSSNWMTENFPDWRNQFAYWD